MTEVKLLGHSLIVIVIILFFPGYCLLCGGVGLGFSVSKPDIFNQNKSLELSIFICPMILGIVSFSAHLFFLEKDFLSKLFFLILTFFSTLIFVSLFVMTMYSTFHLLNYDWTTEVVNKRIELEKEVCFC